MGKQPAPPSQDQPESDLLAEIYAFLDRHGMFKTQFGKELMGDTAFVANLAKGRAILWRTAIKARRFMADRDAQAQTDRKAG